MPTYCIPSTIFLIIIHIYNLSSNFSSQVLSSKVDGLCDYLFDAVANPAFKPWEIPDVTRRLGIHIANIDPAERAIELLHKAAYREGLGNSIYCPPHMVSKIKYIISR